MTVLNTSFGNYNRSFKSHVQNKKTELRDLGVLGSYRSRLLPSSLQNKSHTVETSVEQLLPSKHRSMLGFKEVKKKEKERRKEKR